MRGWFKRTGSGWRMAWALVAVGAAGCGAGPAAPVDRSWSTPDGSTGPGSSSPVAPVWQERFEQLPADFESPSGHDVETVAKVYSAARTEEGEPFLAAHHDAAPRDGYWPPPAVHFGHPFRDGQPPLGEACVLSWRWRVGQHPAISDDPWVDVAASVYVMIQPPGLLKGGQGFKFGWLAKPGPKGTDQRGLLQVELRHDPAGPAWHTETVNLCRLYRQAYGDPTEQRVLYVGVVTDADNTESVATAAYADFELRRR